MKLRIARKIRDMWVLQWKAWNIWHRFQPDAIEDAKVLHEALLSIKSFGACEYAGPTPLTPQEARLMKMRKSHYHGGQISRALTRLPMEEKLEWYALMVEASVTADRKPLTSWDRSPYLGRVCLVYMPLLMAG